jgi:O-antigen/teichoic acid export membrane protein
VREGKTTLVHFLSQVGTSVAGFVATFAIARLLGADGLGVYTLGLALLFWFNVPTTAIASAMNKRMSEGTDQGEFLSAGFVLNAGFGLLVLLLFLAFRPLVDGYVGAPVAGLVGLLVLVESMFAAVQNGLNGQKRVAASGLSLFAERVVRTLAQVVLVVLGFEVAGLFLGYVGSAVVGIAVGLVPYRVWFRRPSIEQFRRLLSYAQYAWLGKLKTRAFGWMDTIVLGFFVAPALVGIYEVAWNLSTMLILVSLSIQQTLFPELSDLGTTDDYERIHHLLNEGLVFVGVFAVPGLFGAAIVGPRVLAIYRPEFATGAEVLLILIAAQLVSAFASQLLNVINAVDRADVAFRINAVFLVVNVALNVALVSAFGWVGAAVATGASAVVTLVLSYAAVVSLVGAPDVPFGDIGFEVVAGAAMAVLVALAKPLAPVNHYATIGLVLLGACVYVLVLLGLSTRIRRKMLSLVPVAPTP